MRVRRTSLITTTLCCLTAASTVAAQPGRFTDRTDVSVVNVDVFVSDRRGQPVRDLQAKDFDLFSDEKKVKISNFNEVGTGPDDSASLVLYFDDTLISTRSRNYVLDALVPFVEREMASGGVAVMVVRFDRLLHVEQGFTTDLEAVTGALEELRVVDSLGTASLATERGFRASVLETMSLMRSGPQDRRLAMSSLDGLLAPMQSYGLSQAKATRLSIDALTALSRSLGFRRGRTKLYFVGDGLAARPLSDLLNYFQRELTARQAPGTGDAAEAVPTGPGPFSDRGQQILQSGPEQGGNASLQKFEETIEPLRSQDQLFRLGAIANTSRVTLYPIKPPYIAADAAGLEQRPSGSTLSLSNLREALEQMAESTGGQSMAAGNDVDSFLRDSAEESVAHYSLGFIPRKEDEGLAHTLRLKGKSRSWRLRYRRSYVPKDLHTRLADRAVGALTVNWIENLHDVDIELVSQQQAADGNYDVVLMLSFPIAELSLEEVDGIHSAHCQVAVVVLDSEGRLSQPQYLELPLQIPTADLEAAIGQQFGARLSLRVAPGRHNVAVGIWEEGGQKASFVSHQFSTGEG